jgi:hypothetical protein
MEQLTDLPLSWTFAQKLFFRFFFFFFLLYFIFNPNDVFPFSDQLYALYNPFFHQLIPWLGKHLLHLNYEITIFTNGSGDTTYDYVALLFIVLLSLLGCAIWTIADPRRRQYELLYYWLTVGVRYYLAVTMFSYGFVKIFKLQFPYPGLTRLLEPYGNSSPMGLAWTFLGYSQGYNYFMGFLEVLCGLFLFFRRTTPLGALLSLLVAGHVMALNYFFDIPVKLLSTAMVVMALYLLSGNVRHLLDLFFLHGSTRLTIINPLRIRKKWLYYSFRILKFLFFAFVLALNISDGADGLHKYGDGAPKTALFGIYNTETFLKNRDTLAPLDTDTLRWKQFVVIGNSAYAWVTIKMMNDSLKSFAYRPDTINKTLVLFSYADTSRKYLFNYSFPQKDLMALKGNWKGESVEIRLKKYDLNRFLLVKRGFHWINEYPLNR